MIQRTVRRSGRPCASLWSTYFEGGSGSMLQNLQKSYCQAKDFQLREPRRSFSRCSHTYPVASSLCLQVSPQFCPLREKGGGDQAHFKGQYGNSIVSPCHYQQAVSSETRQPLTSVFSEVTQLLRSLPRNMHAPVSACCLA